jgi:hypothetical protein
MNERVTDPDQWKRLWGAYRMISAGPTVNELPETARQFIQTYGLPRRVWLQWWGTGIEGTSEISFEPLCRPAELDPSQRILIANEWWSNGSAELAMGRTTGEIIRIDVELDEPESFVNSSVEQLARSLLAGVQWSAGSRADPSADWNVSLSAWATAIAGLDAVAFERPRGFWPALIEYAKERGPGCLTIAIKRLRQDR